MSASVRCRLGHLAVITPYPPTVPGVGTYGQRIIESLWQTGEFNRISVLTHSLPSKMQVDSNASISVESVWQYNSIWAGRDIAVRLCELGPDLVWYNLGLTSFGKTIMPNIFGILNAASSLRTWRPSVATIHEVIESLDLKALGIKLPLGVTLGRFLVSRPVFAASIVCVTLQKSADYLSRYKSFNHIVHIPHGAFNLEKLPESGSTNILFFASIAPHKGLEELITVFIRLRAWFPALSLTIAGGIHPRFPDYLEYLMGSYKSVPGIMWLGYVQENELREVFRRSTLVVLPYAATTGSSSVMYRAAAWGRPIVASSLPELRATAEEAGLQAEFYPHDDQSILESCILRLITSPILRAAQIDHNWNVIATRFNIAKTAEAYLAAFELALNTRRRE